MGSLVSREELRRLEKAAKEKDKKKLANWLFQFENQVDTLLRKEYEKAYQDEILNSERNMLTGIVYALYYSEENYIDKKNLPDFMADLFSTLDMFRTGEYTPQEYMDIMKKEHIILDEYDSAEIYKKYLNILDTDLVNFLRGKYRKIITISGNIKNKTEIIETYQDLSLQGNMVFLDTIFEDKSKETIYKEEEEQLADLHLDKILISDMLYVVNKDNIVDDKMKKEIDFAKKHNKIILYSEPDLIKEDGV